MKHFALKGQQLAHGTTGAVILCNAFFILLMTYGIKFSEIIPFDVVIIAWVIIAGYVALRVTPLLITVSLVFYAALLSGYLIGSLFVYGNPQDLEFVKNIASHFILTALLLGAFSDRMSRVSSKFWLRLGTTAVKLGIMCVGMWIGFIVLETQRLGGYDAVRSYGGANYLTTADLLALFGLIALTSRLVSVFWLASCLVCTVIALVLLGSRAAMVVFAAALLLFPTEDASIYKRLLVTLGVIAVGLTVVVLIYEFLDETLVQRIDSLAAMADDESRMARAHQFDAYVKGLENIPGCLIYPCMPDKGFYVHSILSVQQYFGLLGALMVFFLLASFVLAVGRGYKVPYRAVFVYSLVLMCFARAWVSLIFPVFVAYLLDALVYNLRRLNKRGPKIDRLGRNYG